MIAVLKDHYTLDVGSHIVRRFGVLHITLFFAYVAVWTRIFLVLVLCGPVAEVSVLNLIRVFWHEVCFYSDRFGVSGYPTLKFFPKNKKDGEDYDGGRDVNAIVEFLNKKAGTSRTTSGALSNDVCLTF
jgi:hypothetical protein